MYRILFMILLFPIALSLADEDPLHTRDVPRGPVPIPSENGSSWYCYGGSVELSDDAKARMAEAYEDYFGVKPYDRVEVEKDYVGKNGAIFRVSGSQLTTIERGAFLTNDDVAKHEQVRNVLSTVLDIYPDLRSEEFQIDSVSVDDVEQLDTTAFRIRLNQRIDGFEAGRASIAVNGSNQVTQIVVYFYDIRGQGLEPQYYISEEEGSVYAAEAAAAILQIEADAAYSRLLRKVYRPATDDYAVEPTYTYMFRHLIVHVNAMTGTTQVVDRRKSSAS